MGVGVDVVEAPSPPDEQPYGQQHDDAPDGDLGDLADGLRQVLVQEDERQADEHQRGPVAETPEKAHETGFAYLFPFLLGGDQGRHGGEVVGVARVPQTEQQADRAG